MSDITIISNAEWLADIFETERLITLGQALYLLSSIILEFDQVSRGYSITMKLL